MALNEADQALGTLLSLLPSLQHIDLNELANDPLEWQRIKLGYVIDLVNQRRIISPRQCPGQYSVSNGIWYTKIGRAHV